MRNLLVVIIQGNEMSAAFHYRGWILGINCFRLTSLDIYQWPNGGPGSFGFIYINLILRFNICIFVPTSRNRALILCFEILKNDFESHFGSHFDNQDIC